MFFKDLGLKLNLTTQIKELLDGNSISGKWRFVFKLEWKFNFWDQIMRIALAHAAGSYPVWVSDYIYIIYFIFREFLLELKLVLVMWLVEVWWYPGEISLGSKGKCLESLWSLQIWRLMLKTSWMRYSHLFWKGQLLFETGPFL